MGDELIKASVTDRPLASVAKSSDDVEVFSVSKWIRIPLSFLIPIVAVGGTSLPPPWNLICSAVAAGLTGIAVHLGMKVGSDKNA